jgi:hypothetical protein
MEDESRTAVWFSSFYLTTWKMHHTLLVSLKNIKEGGARLYMSVFDLLSGGGYILYARHGEATIGRDQPNFSFQYCFTQRNLSDMGRRQAIYYGEILRSLQVPVSYPVIASPFCRTIEPAQLAFGQPIVQVDPFWFETYRLSGNLSGAEQRRILDSLRARLEIIPPLGSNRVIIAHSFPAGIGLGQIPDMGTGIIRPLGPGNGYEIVDKLSLSELADMLI